MSDTIRDLFTRYGLRCTPQRRGVYAALSRTRSHPTAEDLFRLAARRIPELSRATVYNTLDTLWEAGLVQKLPGTGSNGSARYDAVSGNHLHVRCRRTDAVADAPEDVSHRVLENIPPSILEDLEQRLGFKVRQVRIELVGEYESEERAPSR